MERNLQKDPKTNAALVNEGRFSYPYIPTGIYAENRSLSNLRFQTQEELTRIKNRIARWFSIYFPEYKDVYGDLKAVRAEAEPERVNAEIVYAPMVAETQGYQYNAEAFEDRGGKGSIEDKGR